MFINIPNLVLQNFRMPKRIYCMYYIASWVIKAAMLFDVQLSRLDRAELKHSMYCIASWMIGASMLFDIQLSRLDRVTLKYFIHLNQKFPQSWTGVYLFSASVQLQPHRSLECIIYCIGVLFLVLQIKLGTVDQSEAQTEWVIRPYMNTSKKRKFLGD